MFLQIQLPDETAQPVELRTRTHDDEPGTRADIPELMRAFDLFVLPSLNEGISNTILEAMASGRAVVAARVGGNGELIEDGLTGTLYASASRDEPFATLARYFGDAALAATQGGRARQRALSRFSLGEMIRQYADFYTQALAS